MTVNAHCPVLGLSSLWYIYQTGYQDPVPPSSKTHPISLPSPPLQSSFCPLPSDARALQATTLYGFDLAQSSVTLAIHQTPTATIHNGKHLWYELWHGSFLLSVLCVRYLHKTLVMNGTWNCKSLSHWHFKKNEIDKVMVFKALSFTRTFLEK